MEDYDEEIYRSLTALRECEDLSDIGLSFEVESWACNGRKSVSLKPGGDQIEVTLENLPEYIQLLLDYRLGGEYNTQLNAFVEGFHDLIPKEELALFRPDELGMLISGVPEIDPDEFANHVVYEGGYSREHPVIEMFFEVFREFTNEERGKLIAFVTGVSKVPAEGFGSYARSGHPFRIGPHGGAGHLPISRTCLRYLGLPPYQSKADMREKLFLGLSPDVEGFHLV
jgi:E3 ubiquitin-protein ligase HUWE1